MSDAPNALRLRRERHARTMRGFTIAMAGSAFLHVLLVGVAVWASRAEPARKVESSIPVQLVKLGKKRDPALLPRLVGEPPPPAADAVRLDDGKTPPKEAPPKDKRSTATTDDKLSARARALLDSPSLDRALEKVEGEGDPDGDANGTTTDATNAATGYAREISRALKASYKLPDTIPAGQRQFLKARVLLFIERSGRITRYEFVEAHPNTAFMAALESLLKTISLPPPPADKAKTFAETGVEVIFSP